MERWALDGQNLSAAAVKSLDLTGRSFKRSRSAAHFAFAFARALCRCPLPCPARHALPAAGGLERLPCGQADAAHTPPRRARAGRAPGHTNRRIHVCTCNTGQPAQRSCGAFVYRMPAGGCGPQGAIRALCPTAAAPPRPPRADGSLAAGYAARARRGRPRRARMPAGAYMVGCMAAQCRDALPGSGLGAQGSGLGVRVCMYVGMRVCMYVDGRAFALVHRAHAWHVLRGSQTLPAPCRTACTCLFTLLASFMVENGQG